MWEVIVGAFGATAVALAGFGLSFTALRRSSRDADRADKSEADLKASIAALAISEHSAEMLRRETTDLKLTNAALMARATTAERQRDDLLHAIENVPPGADSGGTLIAAVHGELERLRTLSQAATGAAAGSQTGGETGIVHDAAAGGPAKP
jgi:hypothetical protein